MGEAWSPAGVAAVSRGVASRWTVGSLAWTVVVSVTLMVVPTGMTQTETAESGPEDALGGAEITTRHVSLLESDGLSVLPVLLFPIALPALALLAGPSRRGVVIGLGAVYLLLAFLAGFTVGMFYLPGAIALLVAGLVDRSAESTTQTGPR